MSMISRDQNALLIKIGFLAILIQNVLLLSGLFVSVGLFEIALLVDIIGFALLGLGFLLFSSHDNEHKNQYLIGGLGFLAWVGLRVTWQFVITSGLNFTGGTDPTQAFDAIAQTILGMIFAFFLSSVAMLVATIAIWHAIRGADGVLLLVFGVLNFIGVFLLFLPLFQLTDVTAVTNAAASLLAAILLKLLIVPVVGIITFIVLLVRSSRFNEAEQLP